MAEGGYDPDSTNPFTPDEGADDTTPIIPHRDEVGMKRWNVKYRTLPPQTSTSQSGHHSQETSFMSETPSGKIYVDRSTQQKDEIDRRIKRIFPSAKTSKFLSKIDEYNRVVIKLDKINSKDYVLLNENGELLIDTKKKKFPDGLRNALGKSKEEMTTEKIAENTVENERAEEIIKELDEQIVNAVGEERKRLVEERERQQEGINERNQENEAIEERLSLRQRIKEIFKKYGFTAIAVASAIATVIGVIVSNLKTGLAKVAQGVGNGLKELGKKLGQILPEMIGAIASFIFRTAGEVIGFLAKNAWLLIVGLVVFAVEQFKNKNK